MDVWKVLKYASLKPPWELSVNGNQAKPQGRGRFKQKYFRILQQAFSLGIPRCDQCFLTQNHSREIAPTQSDPPPPNAFLRPMASHIGSTHWLLICTHPSIRFLNCLHSIAVAQVVRFGRTPPGGFDRTPSAVPMLTQQRETLARINGEAAVLEAEVKGAQKKVKWFRRWKF